MEKQKKSSSLNPGKTAGSFKPVNEDTSKKSNRIFNVRWEIYAKTTGILTLTFKGNKTYQYSEVPKEVVNKLLSSVSLGKFFDAKITGKYKYRKLGEVDFHE